MTFVIGDIHGEITKLKNLIKNIYILDKNPLLIFIGDYINKGENSKLVLDYLIKLQNSIFLMGNHEYYILEYIKNKNFGNEIIKHGYKSTFIDFNITLENIYDKLYLPYKNFFDELIPFYEVDEYFILHQGLDINYLKKPINSIPLNNFFSCDRYVFLKSNKKINNKLIIFGHTGFQYPFYDGFKIGIDTSAVYSKDANLTAFCLEKKIFINDKKCTFNLYDLKLDRCPNIFRHIPYRLRGNNNE
ncbi:metallophosphoesterase [Sulfurospirillum sp. 1307]|jgi:serine/threonine protein phosphatase 1